MYVAILTYAIIILMLTFTLQYLALWMCLVMSFIPSGYLLVLLLGHRTQNITAIPAYLKWVHAFCP